NTTTVRTSPTAPSTVKDLTALAAGLTHTCGLVDDGTLVCWGLGSDGELGNAGVATFRVPVIAAGGAGNFVGVAAGRQHTCAIRADGSVACWGAGASGQIAGGVLAVWSPTRVPLPGQASAIDAGGGHACALVGGVPYCWGDNH